MRKMINRWLAKRAFNALIFWLDCNNEVEGTDFNTTVLMLDILRKFMDKEIK